jgi:hypothetical protein
LLLWAFLTDGSAIDSTAVQSIADEILDEVGQAATDG